MKWSELKALIKSQLSEVLRERIDIHINRHGGPWRQRPIDGWVIFDNQEVIEISVSSTRFTGKQNHMSSGKGLPQALMEYRSLSIGQIMESGSTAIRAFGMLDKRLDQRSLLLLAEQNMDPLVQKFYDIRIRAEDISARRLPMSGAMKAEPAKAGPMHSTSGALQVSRV